MQANTPIIFTRKMPLAWCREHRKLRTKRRSGEPLTAHEQQELDRLNRWWKLLRNCRRSSRTGVMATWSSG